MMFKKSFAYVHVRQKSYVIIQLKNYDGFLSIDVKELNQIYSNIYHELCD